MHDTALEIGRLFFETYCLPGPVAILEIGSEDINGSLRICAPAGCSYTGVDLGEGPGVDITLEQPHLLPFEDEIFDAVVASSTFEHDTMFWLTFLEMLRVVKFGGLIYINAPSNGHYHRYPVDNWRFYPDAALALGEWARLQGHEVELMESFIARRVGDQWNDCVMVFRRGVDNPPIDARIVDRWPGARNIRRGSTTEVENHEELTEDMVLLAEAKRRLDECECERAAAMAALKELEARLSVVEEKEWVGFDR